VTRHLDCSESFCTRAPHINPHHRNVSEVVETPSNFEGNHEDRTGRGGGVHARGNARA